MLTNIKKRDGRSVPFDPTKITNAIAKAGRATAEFDEDKAKELTKSVLSLTALTFVNTPLDVEGVQDIVENVLLASPYRATAKAYILYRAQRSQARAIISKSHIELMDSYLGRKDWKVRENSNTSYSLQGFHNFIASALSSDYWLNVFYTERIRNAHNSGDLHIHDLSQLSVYCVGWDLYDFLKQGFKGIAGNIESGPPKHLRTALGQLINHFYTLQGEAAGAQAVSNFDTLLAPFVRYDNLSYKNVLQCIQEFVFNINVPTRVGFQTPFTNITLDLSPSVIYKDLPAMVGGHDLKETYADYQTEMDMINQALAEVMMKGDFQGRAFTFPIPTYNIGKDFDWDNPKYEAIWKMTGHYGIPYFSNFVNSDLSPEDSRSMCCRLRLDNRQLRKRGGGLFGANPLTGSIGVVTLNLPRLGYLAKNEEDFMRRLDRVVDVALESLIIKRKTLEVLANDRLYPYTKHYLRNIKKGNGLYWANHFSTIGIVGGNEACLNLLNEDIASQKGRTFALNVLNHLRRRLADVQMKTGDFFNLEATPAESTAYRLARLDLQKYPDMIFANGQAKGDNFDPFYTNSTHLPVNYTDDLFEALDLQDDLQTQYTGGTVLHAFLGEEMTDPEMVKNLVRKITANYRLPYFTITPTFSVCQTHGYLAGEKPICPECQEETDVYSRVVGYLRPTNRWHDGKKAEFAIRRPYTTDPKRLLPEDLTKDQALNTLSPKSKPPKAKSKTKEKSLASGGNN
ncbi:MAG: ribonucleoside triphosphate reductase [Deltaproteobacteria bacterium]|nr:ribonucleoside triphosphate reductase [Deltaproteobacteria bacterium]